MLFVSYAFAAHVLLLFSSAFALALGFSPPLFDFNPRGKAEGYLLLLFDDTREVVIHLAV